MWQHTRTQPMSTGQRRLYPFSSRQYGSIHLMFWCLKLPIEELWACNQAGSHEGHRGCCGLVLCTASIEIQLFVDGPSRSNWYVKERQTVSSDVDSRNAFNVWESALPRMLYCSPFLLRAAHRSNISHVEYPLQSIQFKERYDKEH